MATAVIKVGGDGYYQAWTRSNTGVSAYTLVDDGTTHDSNTTYIYSATAGDRSTFTLLAGDIPYDAIDPDVPLTDLQVYAARIYGAIKVTCRLSSSDVDSSSLPGAAKYGWVNASLSRPGGGSWTKDDLASVEIGVVQDENTTSTRVTSIYLLLTYNEIASGAYYPETVAVDNNAYFGAQSVSGKFGRTDGISNGTLTFSGQTVAESVALHETLTYLALSLTGQTVGDTFGRNETVDNLSLTIAGQTIGSSFGRSDAPSSLSLTYTGQSVDSTLGFNDTVDVLLMLFAGQDIGSTFGRSDTVDTDTATLTGQTIGGSLGFSDGVSALTLTLTGQDVGSAYAGGSISYSDIVAALTMHLTGQQIGGTFVHIENTGGGSHTPWGSGYNWKEHDRRERLRGIQADDDDLVAVLTRFVTLEDR